MKKYFLKPLVIICLITALLIPIQIVKSLVDERKSRQSEVSQDMGNIWGSKMIFGGLYISTTEGRIYPESMAITCSMKTEIRKKGIFKIPFYYADISVEAVFPSGIHNDETIGIAFCQSGVIGIEYLEANGKKISPVKKTVSSAKGMYFNDLVLLNKSNNTTRCSAKIRIHGTESLLFSNFSRNTSIRVTSDWKDPNFMGAVLPLSRSISKNGFSAEWNITDNHLAIETSDNKKLSEDAFGVSLFIPQNIYQQTDRVLKYSLLFIFLTFAIFFTYEKIYRLRIHPFQYLLIGGALTIFYLLLLSMSEHISFGLSYAISSLSVISLISLYSFSVLGEKRKTTIITLFLGFLYAFLFVLLRLQEFSLLLGSIGIFTLLAAAMFATRKINWYKES